MIFRETDLPGAWVIEPERHQDDRGFFARTWCQREFEAHGLDSALVQCNVSYNRRRGTLRGMHYQIAPHAEAKLVRCTAGSIWDAILDLRPDSPTAGKWCAVVLGAEDRRALYVPAGMAHGFVTLSDHAEVLYQMSAFFEPSAARGIRWDDPAFDIAWPIAPAVISDRDQGYPLVSRASGH